MKKKNRKPKPKPYVASMTIYNASKMTKKGRKEIAEWLRASAEFVVEHGDNFVDRFTSRYMA
jgi:hypothetical protein